MNRIRVPKFVLVLLDAIVLAVAFAFAFRVRMGIWNVFEWKDGMPVALVSILVVYLVALYFSGLYGKASRQHAYESFLRHAVAIFIAWAVSIAVAFLIDPQRMPPRTVISVHALISMLGILGVRSLLFHYQRAVSKGDNLLSTDRKVESSYVEELIGGDPVGYDSKEMKNFFSGKTVLVTGGGGSIGSELCRLLVSLDAFKVVVVDVSEYNLFVLENRLRAQKRKTGPKLVNKAQ